MSDIICGMPRNMHSFESNSSNVPAFLIKLWKLVDDPTCDELIAWSDSGHSFIIKDQTRFAKELLPQYFKHNNMASFIRQLNMYGFKKVMNYEKTGLKNENTEMEFQHGFFLKEKGDLLEFIKRKIANTKAPEPPPKSNAKDILVDLTSIREKQENMDVLLTKMKKENELLWRELTTMRQKHKAQEQIIQRVIQFLITIVQRSGNQNIGVNVQRKIARMLQDSPTSKQTASSQVSNAIDVLRNKNNECMIVPDQIVSPLGPVIHEVTDIDHDETHSPSTPDVPSIKSPDNEHLSAKSPSNVKDLEKNQSKNSVTSILHSPGNLAVPLEPLSILEALQPKTSTTNVEEVANESILGLPLEYISDNNADNVNSNPDSPSICNVISIPESDENIGPVISIPEGSTINDILISEDGQVISIPEKSNEQSISLSTNYDSTTTSNVLSGNEYFVAPNLCAFSPLASEDAMLSSPSYSKSDFDDALLGESLRTPKIPESDNSAEDGRPNFNKQECKAYQSQLQKVPLNETSMNSTCNEHNYPLKPPESTSLVKNVLSNHLLSVDEKIGLTQDRLASNPWNLDFQLLLGLFNSDEGICNDALASSLPDDINFKNESNDIIGNELVQFTPNMMDIANSPLFEALTQDAEVHSSFGDDAQLFADVLNSAAVAEPVESPTADSSSPKLALNSSPKTPRKRRRVK